MNYRPSKGFILKVLPLAALVLIAGFGLLPQLGNFEVRAIPGEITFLHPTPLPYRPFAVSSPERPSYRRSMEWFEERLETVMTWEHNPWKRSPIGFGDHYFKLQGSTDPLDIAKCKELRRLAGEWNQRLLLRYPELAVPMKQVPNERNGFLKWLEFSENFRKGGPSHPAIQFPTELDDYLNQGGKWNPEAATAWLAKEKPRVDEIRAIAQMPEASVNGIPVERWAFIDARLARSCAQALIIEARAAADRGDVATALQTVRAVKGFSDHFTEIETPTLLGATVQILLQRDLESRVLSEIIPALPADRINPAEWESALNPTVNAPIEFARLMKGEWSASSRQFLLPMLLDAEDPKCPPDSGELLDAYSMWFVEIARTHNPAPLTDLPTLSLPIAPNTRHLSRGSRQIVEVLAVGASAWRKGWQRTQSASALTQAAFAIMKGQPIPKDPIYGKDYSWDPATRQLSMPAGPEFDAMEIKPIIVP